VDSVSLLLQHVPAGSSHADRTQTVNFDRPTTDGCVAGLQILNPAETFGDIIVDYSYVECSSACITALAAFAAKYVGECFSVSHAH
jgi:hypothetical protein